MCSLDELYFAHSQGTDDEELDNELRLHAVNSYLDLIDKQPLPDVLIQVICWVCAYSNHIKIFDHHFFVRKHPSAESKIQFSLF